MKSIRLLGYELSWGKRNWTTEDFKWFYCPLLQDAKKCFVFFWWFGHQTYIALQKRRKL